jgi:ADP-ribosylglycohydrolase
MSLKESIRRSALWAAYGDAIGFITEMCNEASLVHRTRGKSRINGLIPWVRKIGGEFGVYVELPLGCYSDDTQLRLATSRSIRGDGSFDVETFSKIELPVWLSYDLGAGTGTKTAAQSLKKNQVQWNSNFFVSKYSVYTNGGGNGAAMRIQPHVWCSPIKKRESDILRDVIRNTITTHGHPRAIIGASFHALILRKTLLMMSIPNPSEWSNILDKLLWIPKIIQSDSELTLYWLPHWEKETGESFEKATQQCVEEFKKDLLFTSDFIEGNINDQNNSYTQLVSKIGGLSKETAGSAPKTALLAAYLSYKYQDNPLEGIIQAVNLIGSDTDTIATMAGALLGSITNSDPPEKVVDIEYIEAESDRLFRLSQGQKTDSFPYPDLLYWQPPESQIDALGQHESKWIFQGLGQAFPFGNPIEKRSKNNIIWQWFKLNFGQTVLVRRRADANQVSEKSLPVSPIINGNIKNISGTRSALEPRKSYLQPGLWDNPLAKMSSEPLTLESAIAMAIRSKLKENIIGSLLLQLSEQDDGINKALTFAEAIAKAKRARQI